MAIPGNATQLIALDAMVVDTETTGLDPAKARLVEIAAVALLAGRLNLAGTMVQRVRPDQPIPAAATAVHGIDDAAVRAAPDFRAVWPEFAALMRNHIIIGHALGFDMALLRQECLRAGLPWAAPRCLDTRLLAQAARPDLAGYSIEQLAAWLEVEISGRHSALGDAITTGRIFLALVPPLRERGIRTLAEAEQACRTLTATRDEEHRAGWADIAAAPDRSSSAGAPLRLDSQPFRHRVADAMSRPQAILPDATVAQAVQRMEALRISSLFVAADPARMQPHTTAIVTERDVLRALADRGAATLGRAVREISNAPVLAIPADTLVYRAIASMRRRKVRHLGVTDEQGLLCGAISARDLLRQRAEEAIWLGEEIDEATDVPQLARGWTKLPLVAERLVADTMSGREIAAVISRELCALTARAAQIAEERMRGDGLGGPPCAYAVAVLGSAGRGESLLAMDQDNALVFAEGDPGSDNDQWFASAGGHVADILNEVGVPYCSGGVMASNPAWRGSLSTWRARIGDWIRRSSPQDLLSVDIFFDLKGVHGDVALTTSLRREAFEAASGETGFIKLLAEPSGATEPGLGMFGRFRTTQGRIDLKKSGLLGIVSAARALAIRHRILDRATPARLQAIGALGIGAAQDLEALIDAHAAFMDFILGQQIEDMANGVPPRNTVVVKRLSAGERRRLRVALEAVRHVDEMTRSLLFRG
jgi:CBS domain-containing protein